MGKDSRETSGVRPGRGLQLLLRAQMYSIPCVGCPISTSPQSLDKVLNQHRWWKAWPYSPLGVDIRPRVADIDRCEFLQQLVDDLLRFWAQTRRGLF